MRNSIKELEESVRKLEEIKKGARSSEPAVKKGIFGGNPGESRAPDTRLAIEAKIREFENAIVMLRRDIEDMKGSRGAAEKSYAGDGSDSMRNAQKIYMEMKSRMDVLQKYIEGKLAMIDKKIDFVSKSDSDKLMSMASEEKKIDESLKIFALNSDVQKIWKDIEGLRRYVDEKSRTATGLANSLRVWETRNMQLMEKEHDFDEKLKAFPELKLLEGRIRKLERAIVELQKHFVAAQITEPIIME